jgi:hypothetical protein
MCKPRSAVSRGHAHTPSHPGARLVDEVAVSNPDPEPLTVAVYPADAYNTSVDGAFALRNQEDARDGVGAWIRTGVQEYTIDPGMRAELPFELTIPPTPNRATTPGRSSPPRSGWTTAAATGTSACSYGGGWAPASTSASKGRWIRPCRSRIWRSTATRRPSPS